MTIKNNIYDSSGLSNITKLIKKAYEENNIFLLDSLKEINFSEVYRISVYSLEHGISYEEDTHINNIISNLPFEYYKDLIDIQWIINDNRDYSIINKCLGRKRYEVIEYLLKILEDNINTPTDSGYSQTTENLFYKSISHVLNIYNHLEYLELIKSSKETYDSYFCFLNNIFTKYYSKENEKGDLFKNIQKYGTYSRNNTFFNNFVELIYSNPILFSYFEDSIKKDIKISNNLENLKIAFINNNEPAINFMVKNCNIKHTQYVDLLEDSLITIKNKNDLDIDFQINLFNQLFPKEFNYFNSNISKFYFYDSKITDYSFIDTKQTIKDNFNLEDIYYAYEIIKKYTDNFKNSTDILDKEIKNSYAEKVYNVFFNKEKKFIFDLDKSINYIKTICNKSKVNEWKSFQPFQLSLKISNENSIENKEPAKKIKI